MRCGGDRNRCAARTCRPGAICRARPASPLPRLTARSRGRRKVRLDRQPYICAWGPRAQREIFATHLAEAWQVDFAESIARPLTRLAAVEHGRVIDLINRRRAWPDSRAVVEVPAIQHANPVAHAAGAVEGLLHFDCIGAEAGVF